MRHSIDDYMEALELDPGIFHDIALLEDLVNDKQWFKSTISEWARERTARAVSEYAVKTAANNIGEDLAYALP